MIYTLGCSFTKWCWPTWSDWIASYQSQPVKNLAHSGYTNSLIYYQLLQISENLCQDDCVYVMWTGSSRICEWYDLDSIVQRDCLRFFPETDGQLWFGHDVPYLGMYKSHPDRLPSLSHMQIEMFNTILQTQRLLNQVGCSYKMMFWQNPWCDSREIFKPQFLTTWQNKSSLTAGEINQANCVMSLSIVQAILKQIKWERFIAVGDDPSDPMSYNGLWEYTLGSKELVSMAHQTDPHPNTLAHHDWAVEFLCDKANPHLRDSAYQLARSLRNIVIPPHDRRKEIWHLVDH